MRKKGLRRESATLRDALTVAGMRGRDFVEIGCGIGGLTRELVTKAGAATGTGLDMSKEAIRKAEELTAQAGLSGRVKFEIANGAEQDLPDHDAVVLDKVVCCYPRPDQLLDHALDDDTVLCGLTIPISRGIGGRMVAAVIKIQNLIFKMRKIGFRAFVHPQGWIDALIEARGLTLKSRSVKFPWVISIYAREEVSSSVRTASAATSR